jgi:hypothetical protein
MQPRPSDPVTEYVVVTTGTSINVGPVDNDGFHVYVEAPLAVSVTEPELHRTDGVAAIETTGRVLTLIVIVSLAIHPDPLSPSTV